MAKRMKTISITMNLFRRCITLITLIILLLQTKDTKSFNPHAVHYKRILSSTKVQSQSNPNSEKADTESVALSNLNLQKCLRKEYASFFSPMERQFYSSNVEFIDPLNSFIGIDKYQNNVDLLAGRTALGKILFSNAVINLHNIEQLGTNRLRTRWTLQVTVKFLPWQPRPKFSGISDYTISNDGVVVKQEDYWDSINLIDGEYKAVSKNEGITDFLNQLKKESNAEMSAPELPVSDCALYIAKYLIYFILFYPN